MLYFGEKLGKNVRVCEGILEIRNIVFRREWPPHECREYIKGWKVGCGRARERASTHAVVERLVGAVLVEVDAAVVELEGLLRRVDGDGHGPHGGHGRHQLPLITRGDVHEAGHLRAGILCVVPSKI